MAQSYANCSTAASGRKFPGSNEVEGKKCFKRQRLAEPPIPLPNTQSKRGRLASVHGSFMHFIKSADGKLRWLPPSSSCSQDSGTDDQHKPQKSETDLGKLSQHFSGEPGACDSDNSKCSVSDRFDGLLGTKVHLKAILTCSEESQSSDQISPDRASYCQGGGDSESSIAHSVETAQQEHSLDDSIRQEASFMPERTSLSASVSGEHPSSSKDNSTNGSRELRVQVSLSQSQGISPYLSSKLKPGRHIIGEKLQRVYIRPGQLRRWAVGNSPAVTTNLASLHVVAANGRNACRTLF